MLKKDTPDCGLKQSGRIVLEHGKVSSSTDLVGLSLGQVEENTFSNLHTLSLHSARDVAGKHFIYRMTLRQQKLAIHLMQQYTRKQCALVCAGTLPGINISQLT
jgi:hypothetical protein